MNESERNYSEGTPNPDKFGYSLRPLWNCEHSEKDCSEEVAKLLKREVLFTDSNGYENEIIAGAVNPKDARTAHIECRSKELSEDYVDVDFYLYVWNNGERSMKWEIPTYNPYFGCEVGFMKWIEDRIVIIYQEKHLTILCVIGLDGEPKLCGIGYEWKVGDRAVTFSGEEPHLWDCLSIPDLEWLAPLTPFPSGEVPPINHPALAQNGSKFAAELAQRMFGPLPPQPEADLIIGAIAYPFWEERPPASTTYEKCKEHEHYWYSPRLLPFDWYMSCTKDNQERFLEVLTLAESFVAEDRSVCVDLAGEHVGRQSSILKKYCLDGQLPEETDCRFWSERSQAEFRENLELFPAGFRAVYDELAAKRER